MRLFFIILSQFFSGSIWFAGNIAFQGQAFLLSAVQLGFIIGTLIFAFFNISDRFSPVRVFFCSALMGAIFNYSAVFLSSHPLLVILSRFFCGICLAGIYPVGMKIAAAWYPQTLSRALGWLVGALVLATGLPHLINFFSFEKNADHILLITSLLCLSGGIIQLFLVTDGPHLPKGSAFNMAAIKTAFSNPEFRASSFGYFGHMWELYAVFAYVPVLLKTIVYTHADLWSFLFFGFGFSGCAAGGIIALKLGSRTVALTALFSSGMICLASPFLADLPQGFALALILLWGIMIVADSPQFSALNAQSAPREYVGSALTIVNCIGFLITIFSIELTGLWIDALGIKTAFLPLVLGPVFGFLSLKK